MNATVSLKAAVASFIQELERHPEGLYRFVYSPSTNVVEYRGPATLPAPVLTLPASPDVLERVLSAFSSWDGEVQIGALRCEGLPSDVWIF